MMECVQRPGALSFHKVDLVTAKLHAQGSLTQLHAGGKKRNEIADGKISEIDESVARLLDREGRHLQPAGNLKLGPMERLWLADWEQAFAESQQPKMWCQRLVIYTTVCRTNTDRVGTRQIKRPHVI
jgi:hypothetical protein